MLKTVSQKSYQQVVKMVINSINVFYVFDKNRYTKERVPMIVVIGDEEVANKSIALRNRRTREQSNLSKQDFIDLLNKINEESRI